MEQISKYLQFISVDKVKYLCSCGNLEPLCRIYFCRHCLKLKCGDCVFHEVDSHYCSNCAENMPVSEARIKKNRCDNCWDCPNCGHALSVRASTIMTTSLEDPPKPISKKVYYQSCPFCRWSSRDAGIPDALGGSGPWPDAEAQFGHRVTQLTEYYRSLAQVEKIEQEQKRQQRRKQAFGERISSSARKRLSGLHVSVPGLSIVSRPAPSPLIQPSVPVETVEELSEEFINQPVKLYSILSLPQRHRSVDRQPTTTHEMLSSKKSLMIRRSQRCRRCEHNLCKPEYNPSSIKFKIHLGGYHHVPEITIFSLKNNGNGDATLVLRICNRSQHATNIRLLPLEELGKLPIEKAKQQVTTEQKRPEPAESFLSLPSLTSARVISDQLTSAEEIEMYETMAKNAASVKVTGRLELATDSINLLPRDDLAEYEASSMSLLKDDPKYIIWRKTNKVGYEVKLKRENAEADVSLIGLVLQWQTFRAGALPDSLPSIAETAVFLRI
ncbi:dynactin subunit 4-like [Artemia franciscana]|uniref:Dynactin subunit 4 n=1 Tax=Artemia franciscana TaxID=6661 RepID=A0AA88I031_ARTSF|nr:hypothetical protein QYM36_006310 [Artemia franciscana]